MSVNMRPGTASMFPSPLQAAGEAGVSAGLAYDRQGEAQMREMSRMGLNPDSPRYAGLRQEFGLRKTAGVAGAKTRAAQSARAASFERLLDMISRGRSGGAFAPREQVLYGGRGGSSTPGRREDAGMASGGDYNARVQRYLAQLRGEAVPGAEGRPGVIGIGETRSRVIGIGGGPGSAAALRAAFPDAGTRRAMEATPAPQKAVPFSALGPYFGSGGLRERPDTGLTSPPPMFDAGGSSGDSFDDVWR